MHTSIGTSIMLRVVSCLSTQVVVSRLNYVHWAPRCEGGEGPYMGWLRAWVMPKLHFSSSSGPSSSLYHQRLPPLGTESWSGAELGLGISIGTMMLGQKAIV